MQAGRRLPDVSVRRDTAPSLVPFGLLSTFGCVKVCSTFFNFFFCKVPLNMETGSATQTIQCPFQCDSGT